MSKEPPAPQPKPRSLANYLVRYDLADMLAEARADYSQAMPGTPRLLDQKEIAARFRKRSAKSAPNE